MAVDTRAFLESVNFEEELASNEAIAEAPPTPGLDLDKLPPAVVSGTTLIDFSATPSATIRSSVSLAMLFAARVASKAMAAKPDADDDDWLAAYTSNLAQLGFAMTGSSVTQSKFKKTGIEVHKAIIPFLTIAFGGAAIGPVILAGLENLRSMNESDPWIALFDKETRRFTAQEMHFAAVSSDEQTTVIRYAIARIDVETSKTTILFFKLGKTNATFESATKTLTAGNSFLDLLEPQLRDKLKTLATMFIAQAEL